MKVKPEKIGIFDGKVSPVNALKPLTGGNEIRANSTPGVVESISSVGASANPHRKNNKYIAGEICSIGSPQRILDDISRIRNVVKTVAKIKSPCSISSRSPSDYTPRRRRSRRRSSSESSSRSWTDRSDTSPYWRRSRRYRRRRR